MTDRPAPAPGQRVRIVTGEPLSVFAHASTWADLIPSLEAAGVPLDGETRARLLEPVYGATGSVARLTGRTGRLVEPDAGGRRGPAGAWWVEVDGLRPRPRFVTLYPRQWRPITGG